MLLLPTGTNTHTRTHLSVLLKRNQLLCCCVSPLDPLCLREPAGMHKTPRGGVCVCVCVAGERERERKREWSGVWEWVASFLRSLDYLSLSLSPSPPTSSLRRSLLTNTHTHTHPPTPTFSHKGSKTHFLSSSFSLSLFLFSILLCLCLCHSIPNLNPPPLSSFHPPPLTQSPHYPDNILPSGRRGRRKKRVRALSLFLHLSHPLASVSCAFPRLRWPGWGVEGGDEGRVGAPAPDCNVLPWSWIALLSSKCGCCSKKRKEKNKGKKT